MACIYSEYRDQDTKYIMAWSIVRLFDLYSLYL